jgi:hypothetical protein
MPSGRSHEGECIVSAASGVNWRTRKQQDDRQEGVVKGG